MRDTLQDNKDGHLIYKRGDLIGGRCKLTVTSNYLFELSDEIIDTLGEGTFGKVVQVKDTRQFNKSLALKIIKNVPKYRDAARLEINVLRRLMERDPGGSNLIIQLLHDFDYHGHM